MKDTMVETQTKLQPPNKPPSGNVVVADFPEDEIREIGNKIADLTPEQAEDLLRYIKLK